MGRRIRSAIAILAASIVLSHGAPGDLDPSFNPTVNGWVSAICVQPDGKILIGGNFTNVDGASCGGFARLNSDGSLDPGFIVEPAPSNWVDNIVLQPDNKILIAGSFKSINGTNRDGIARLNPDGSLDSSFDLGTGGFSGYNQAVAIQTNGQILIVGTYGTNHQSVTRANPDGSIDYSFAPVVSGYSLFAVAVQPDGKILIGGAFDSVNGTSCEGIARLDSTGNLDPGFAANPGVNKQIVSIALQADGKIILGASDAESYLGTNINWVARLNQDGTLDTNFDSGLGPNDGVKSVAVQADGAVVAGGEFTAINGVTRTRVARLTPDGILDTNFDPGTNFVGLCALFCPYVSVVTVQADGKVLVGGNLTKTNGASRNYLARLFGTGLPQFTSVTASGDGSIQLIGYAATNAHLRLEESSNLSEWSPLEEFTNSNGTFVYTDSSAGSNPYGFYRVVWLP